MYYILNFHVRDFLVQLCQTASRTPGAANVDKHAKPIDRNQLTKINGSLSEMSIATNKDFFGLNH
jgi:hypothetical protein